MGKKARELKKAAEALHQEERNGKKDRKWRKNVKAVEKASFNFFLFIPMTILNKISDRVFKCECCFFKQELLLLEDDTKALEEMYPQGEQVIIEKIYKDK